MADRGDGSSNHTKLRSLVQGEAEDDIRAFAEYLLKEFPALQAKDANFEAERIVLSAKIKAAPFHKGKEDLRNIGRFFKTLEKAEGLLHELSPWAREAIARSFASIDGGGGLQYLGNLHMLRRHQSEVLEYYEADHAASKPIGQTNLKAILVVEAAIRFWRKYANKPKVPKVLNDAGPLEGFLEVALSAAGVHANTRAAFEAWRRDKKYIADKN